MCISRSTRHITSTHYPKDFSLRPCTLSGPPLKAYLPQNAINISPLPHSMIESRRFKKAYTIGILDIFQCSRKEQRKKWGQWCTCMVVKGEWKELRGEVRTLKIGMFRNVSESE
jgi:hypothetical protein